MSYDPVATDASRPVGDDPVSTLGLELRRIKAVLLELKTAKTLYEVTTFPALDADIAALEADILALESAHYNQFQLIVGSGNFVVPASVTKLLVMAVGGGQGGQGGWGNFRVISGILSYDHYASPEQYGFTGNCGEVIVSELTVVPGDTIPYVCGAGTAGTAGDATVLNLAAGYDNQQDHLILTKYTRCNENTGAIEHKYRAVYNTLSTDLTTLMAATPFIAASTTFGAAGPSQIIAAGGGYHTDTILPVSGRKAPFFGLGAYGRGGMGGHSRKAWMNNTASTAAVNGAAGTAGAILLFW